MSTPLSNSHRGAPATLPLISSHYVDTITNSSPNKTLFFRASNPLFLHSYLQILVEDHIPTAPSYSFMENLQQLLSPRFKHLLTTGKTQIFSESLRQSITESMATTSCRGQIGEDSASECRDESAAFGLKMVAIAAILVAGVAGVAIPLIGKRRSFLRTEGSLFVAAKAFAAGVILATGFVHMLDDGSSALSNPCLPAVPWSKFPFSGFVAMMAALGTLVVDFVGTQFYERKQEGKRRGGGEEITRGLLDSERNSEMLLGDEEGGGIGGDEVFGEEKGGGMHIVGMHAHAAHHRHSHPNGQDACDGRFNGSHSHSHGIDEAVSTEGGGRHVVVSQILELGIVSHSVIIGLSLGVSQSPCSIRPLIAALSFHQFFEGFALGGCISQAQLKTQSAFLMACFFAITTPAGIAIGSGLASLYNPKSPRALVVEGLLDSVSAGILVYMALVDLIAADFLSKRMRCNVRLQVVSYFTLFLGATLMSLLAIWA